MPLPLRQPGSLRAPFLLKNLCCSFNQQTFDGHLLYQELQAGGRHKAGLYLPLYILRPQTGDKQEIIMSPSPGEATVLCAICLRGQKEKDTRPRTQVLQNSQEKWATEPALVKGLFCVTPWTSGCESSQVISQIQLRKGALGDTPSCPPTEGLHRLLSLTLWPCLALLTHGPATHPLPAHAVSAVPSTCGSRVPTRRVHWTAPEEESSKKS